MNKKHFIILGRVGLIYYSWLVMVLLLSLIVAYEGTKALNFPAIIWSIIFIVLLGYTFLTSYWQQSTLKLPFKTKIEYLTQPVLYCSWHCFKVYQLQIAEVEEYYLLRIEF